MLGHKTHLDIFISENLSTLNAFSETKKKKSGWKSCWYFPSLAGIVKKYPKLYLHTDVGSHLLSSLWLQYGSSRTKPQVHYLT